MPENWKLGKVPTNINGLSPNSWQFNIMKLPQLSFYSQTVNLPRVTNGAPEQATRLTNIPWHGDKLIFEALNLTFLIDEEMKNYNGLFNWMVALSPDIDNSQYKNFIVDETKEFAFTDSEFKSDATLQILDSHNSPIRTVRFVDAFPTSLQTSTVFSSTNADVVYLVGIATFAYTLYFFE